MVEERRQQLINKLKQKKSVTVKTLATQLFVSEATIRRDLAKLEKQGVLKRSHGGAVIYENMGDETSLLVREQKNIKEKQKIAELALDFISSSSTIFMDSSSTTGMIISMLAQYKFLTVITNGLKNALALAQYTTAKTYITSGLVNLQSTAAVGSDSVDYINNMNVQIALISCGGIDTATGITEATFEQAKLKAAMLSNAKIKVLLCDHSKFLAPLMFKICDFDKIDYIITDKQPSKQLCSEITKSGCEILVAELK